MISYEWFPWYPALYRADTMHLTPEQDGIYRRLIDHYMETRQPLPDNDAALARIAGASVDAWAIAAAIVRPFFKPSKDGLLHHKRCDEILAGQDGRNRKQSEKGKKGAEKRWGKAIDNKEENSHGHSTSNDQALPADSKGKERTRQDKTSAAYARARDASGQQGKKTDQKVFSHDECKAAARGDPAWTPDVTDGDVLPGGWQDEAEKYTRNDDRISKSWRKFKDTTDFPYRFDRWKSWLKNEG